MNVRALIAELQKIDPDTSVKVYDPGDDEYVDATGIAVEDGTVALVRITPEDVRR